MAKGRRSDWKPGAGPAQNQGGMQPDMLEKIKKMQDEMAVTQTALESEIINVTAAGGAISIAITGHQRVQTIKIDPSLIDPNDVSMLEDTLVAAVNEAIIASQEHSAKRMEEVTGGVQIPGFM
jgi:DNA-binding YbaB/EbfC family protein